MEELTRHERDFVKGFPFEDYAAYLRDVKTYIGRSRRPYVGRRRKIWFESLVTSHDPSSLCRFNKFALAYLMKESLPRIQSMNMPCDVPKLYHQWFERVLEDMRELPDDHFRLHNDEFIIDLSVCCLRSIPVGGAWVVQKSRVGLGPLFGEGALQFFLYLPYILRGTGNFPLYWIIHTAFRYISLFRPEEMSRAYLRIAELLKWDQSTKGIYRGGWHLDPKIEEISPNLAYLRTVPQQNGARFFRGLTSQGDIEWAMSYSPIRRRLYKEGVYRPSAFVYIWPREAVLAWADNQKIDTP